MNYDDEPETHGEVTCAAKWVAQPEPPLSHLVAVGLALVLSVAGGIWGVLALFF